MKLVRTKLSARSQLISLGLELVFPVNNADVDLAPALVFEEFFLTRSFSFRNGLDQDEPIMREANDLLEIA